MGCAKKGTGGVGRDGPAYTRLYPSEYAAWTSMRQRCNNPRCKEFTFYGGRGITICRRWDRKNGFKNFLTELGPKPSAGLSLHRVDNDGDYRPGNVVWADRVTQARNMRNNRRLTFDGRCQTLGAWAVELGMKPGTLGARLARGWTVAEALTKPVERRRPFREWAHRARQR
jgi:hypothetical protein